MINHLYSLGFVLGLEDEKFSGTIAYGEVLFHKVQLFSQFLIHLEEVGYGVRLIF